MATAPKAAIKREEPPKREEPAPVDMQKVLIAVQRATAASTLAASLVSLRGAASAAEAAEAYEDAYHIIFPARAAPDYIAWAKAKNIKQK